MIPEQRFFMKGKLLKSVLLAAVTGLFVAGCNRQSQTAPGEVAVNGAPPPPVQVDVETPSPGPDYVWIGGVWVWGGGGWVWERGHWDRRPFAGAVWEPNRYVFHDGRHGFVRGRWR